MEKPTCAAGASVTRRAGETIAVLAEIATVEKRVVETGRAAIHKTVSERDETVEMLLARQDVTVERVPIDRVVTEIPPPRQDGETWVVPVMEERLVIEKQLVLKEELRIRTKTTLEPVQHTVLLREEHVTVEVSGSAKMTPNSENTEGDPR